MAIVRLRYRARTNYMKKAIFILFVCSVFLTPPLVFAQTQVFDDGSTLTTDSEGKVSATNATDPSPAVSQTKPAAGGINDSYLRYYRDVIIWTINNVLLPVVISIAFIVFIWGVYKYFILGAANEDKRAEGRQLVLWGVIGFVIIFTVWGLVNIVSATLGLRAGGNAPPIPTIGTQGNRSGTVPASRGAGGGSSGAGCKDPYADNYDRSATGYVNCEYGSKQTGCGDPAASNYNPAAKGYYVGCEYGPDESSSAAPQPEEGGGAQSPTDNDSAVAAPYEERGTPQGTEI